MTSALAGLNRELNRPSTPLGRGYMAFMIATIFGSIFFMFLIEEYPKYYTHENPIVIGVEAFLLVAFSIDFLLRLVSFRVSDWKNGVFLIFDGLAILPSLAIVAMALGWDVHPEDVVFFTLLRLFRLLRVLKLLRMGNLLVEVLGVSVFTMVFGAIALHLGIRVFTQMLQPLFGIDLHDFIVGPVLLMAVTAVGSAFGISMAITFGMVNKKREEIGELHRMAMDAVGGFERDFRDVFHETVDSSKREEIFGTFNRRLDGFLSAQVSYEDMKADTAKFLDQVRAVVKARPSMDVPFHAVLVQRLATFLTRTQSNFPPAFYSWMKLLANLYFILVMLAAPGIIGLCVQLLVIFVFYGLLMIIEDMDFAIDTSATLFNAKILKV
jgi:voltage-gated potassium channel